MILIQAELYHFPPPFSSPPVIAPSPPPTHAQAASLFFFDLLLLRHSQGERKHSWYGKALGLERLWT